MPTENVEFIDLSHPLDAKVPAYPGHPVYACHSALTIDSDGCNVSSIVLGSHTGTHIDAPYHFIESGLKVDEIALSTFVGPATVADLSYLNPWEEITPTHLADTLAQLQGGNTVLLLHTGWSKYWGTPNYPSHPYVNEDAARALVAAGLRIIGFDTLGPDSSKPKGAPDDFFGPGPADAHKILLGAGVVLAENMRNLHLLQVPPKNGGRWVVHIAPLAIAGGDGSPVRAYAYATI